MPALAYAYVCLCLCLRVCVSLSVCLCRCVCVGVSVYVMYQVKGNLTQKGKKTAQNCKSFSKVLSNNKNKKIDKNIRESVSERQDYSSDSKNFTVVGLFGHCSRSLLTLTFERQDYSSDSKNFTKSPLYSDANIRSLLTL